MNIHVPGISGKQGMILLTQSAIVFMLGVTNLLKEYLVSISVKLDVYSYYIQPYLPIANQEPNLIDEYDTTNSTF